MTATIQKLWKSLFLLALISLAVYIFYFDENKDKKLRDDEIPIVFYKEAYLDYRYSPPRLRVFTINPCLHSQSILLIKIGSKFFKLHGEPLEGECPWAWAPTCYYNSYIFETSVTDPDLQKSENISIILQNKNIEVPLKSITPKTQEGLTVCVQPVYWYNQFQNIILFIESWRNQGATHFIVYFHSSTNEVWMVLDYYQRLGILTIKSWPKFGDLSARYPEINSQVYRIAHTMAANLCILEMNTTLGTIVDFDEIIVPTTGSPNILESSRQLLKEAKVGALEFKHTRIQLNLNSEKIGFERKSLENPILLDKSGPVKLIFNTSSVGIILTHSIKKFISNSLKTIDAPIRLLLHYRYNGGEEAKKKRNFALFEKNFEAHIKNMDTVTKSIFQNISKKINLYDPRIILELNECIEEMRQSLVCRSTVTNCKDRMEGLANWKYDTTFGIFVF
ncbi:unnamed protein product [Caenorhabditis nigoni]